MQVAALDTRFANDGAKTTLDLGQASPDLAWVANGPQAAGARAIFSVTDTASAARYGLQVASLSRAGDDGAQGVRVFIAPDTPGLVAGERAMTPTAVPGVLAPNPAATAPGAYPLTMLTYAAAMPRSLDPTTRPDFANFITYAVGPGQVEGLQFGQLPPGYAPLPFTLVAEANAAATTIRNGDPSPASAAAGLSGAGGLAMTTGPQAPTSTPTVGGITATVGGTTSATSTGALKGSTVPGQSKATVDIRKTGPRDRTPLAGVNGTRFVLLIALGTGVAATLAAHFIGKRRSPPRSPAP
jgi:hypothetical protein